jgi:hypothetical protein
LLESEIEKANRKTRQGKQPQRRTFNDDSEFREKNNSLYSSVKLFVPLDDDKRSESAYEEVNVQVTQPVLVHDVSYEKEELSNSVF